MLDLACGNGAVTGYALQAAPRLKTCCLDYSASAVLELRKRYPGSLCLAGNARQLPFPDGCFDLVVSQFGLEYAGFDAVAEAARVLSPGGQLAAVLHLRDGGIYRECAANLQAVNAIRDSELLPLARDAFNAGFDVNAKTGTVEAFKAAEKRFTPAIRALEKLMREMGEAIASGLPRKLYQDIAHMYQRMSAYDRADIINWVDGMMMQLDAYGGRMSSMLDAALDSAQLQAMRTLLERQGVRVLHSHSLEMGADPEPAAWVMEAART
jgi:ubiquinone/menaquinone biosynthesis C-methylase UbiE